MKSFWNVLVTFLRSPRLMVGLFLMLAAAMAIGTFIENEHTTDTARILIYNAWWFEGLLVLFVLNFAFSIKKYKLMGWSQLPVLLIHFGLAIIILGAAITRYFSFEGLMSIREGATSQQVVADQTQLKVEISSVSPGQNERQIIEKEILISQYTPDHNNFSITTDFQRRESVIAYKHFVEKSKIAFRRDKKGVPILKLVLVNNGEREDHYLIQGERVVIGGTEYTFDNPNLGAINFYQENQLLKIGSPDFGYTINMANGEVLNVGRNSHEELRFKSLYTIGKHQFVVPEKPEVGFLVLEANDSDTSDDGLVLSISSGGIARDLIVMGQKHKIGNPKTIEVGGVLYKVSFGSKVYSLPFSLGLKDFKADRYPGTTNGYSSFKSKVVVIDEQSSFDSDIFMNNVLDYKGYRFFQSSFHPDEKGTILSVSHDRLGTNVTYTGYFTLYLGLLMILFHKRSRFRQVAAQLNRPVYRGAMLLFFLNVLLFSNVNAQTKGDLLAKIEEEVNTALLEQRIPKNQADEFGELVIQDYDGRMKPVDTYSSELLRKISKREKYLELNSNQVLLSMIQYPELWYNVPMVYVKRENDSIRSILEVSSDSKHIALVSFFDESGNYKLEKQVNESYLSIIPNQFEKDFIEVDRRVNLFLNVLNGNVLRLFPVPGHKENLWISPIQVNQAHLQKQDSLFVSHALALFISSLTNAAESGNYSNAIELKEKIHRYQTKFGGSIVPNAFKIKSEIIYNKANIFKRLKSVYLMVSSILLILSIIQIYSDSMGLRLFLKATRWLIYLGFVAHTLGLAARWYVSGHAPWSDAYESIIYISWAVMFFGVLLNRRSDLALAAIAFVTSIILMVAHWNWLDPSIANLQPVLDSYWLMIHVSIIVASYGPFTIGMSLGIVSLLFLALLNKKNYRRLKPKIIKLNLINELALTIGLIMLTIGNFLGGQWANESWGRYWAWDPKETWALISIMIYAFIIHMRLIPGLKGYWAFSFASVLAFYSILMTYFGVNFYLSGLHSYAKGENIVTPGFIYYSLIALLIIAVISRINYRKYFSKVKTSRAQKETQEQRSFFLR